MSIELKIKSKHLALEPAIIRKEEQKLHSYIKKVRAKDPKGIELQKFNELNQKFFSLRQHRKEDVRQEARATYLARAFMKGTPYKAVERSRKQKDGYIQNTGPFYGYILDRVTAMVIRYKMKKNMKYMTLEAANALKSAVKKEIIEWANA